MTIAARHLQTRRPRQDRDVTWSRRFDSNAGMVTWNLFRRDHKRTIHFEQTSAYLNEPLGLTTQRLRTSKRELRDFVDEIDLAAMEQTA